MVPNLIFDVGMHNGDDTAYYLARGYNVVAVEADPTLIEDARKRFPDEVRDGRLILLNCAIGDADGKATFWVCPHNRAWNSFTREVTARHGYPVEPIDVPVRRFKGILAQYGVPYYLKIDIEGYDRACLEDIDPADRPRYVSWEVSSLEDMVLVRSKGYNAFKCISQATFLTLEVGRARGSRKTTRKHAFTSRLRALVRKMPAVHRVARAVSERRRGKDPEGKAAVYTVSTIHWDGKSWSFPLGSAGPFGPDLPGEWKAMEVAAYEYYDYWLHTASRADMAGRDWFDMHATTLDESQAPKIGSSLQG